MKKTPAEAARRAGGGGAIEATDLKGQLLVAMPHLTDANFHRTVVILCEHTREGAMGLVVNRPLPFNLGRVYEEQKIEEEGGSGAIVHFGGPVQGEVGFVLYEGGKAYEESVGVVEEVRMGTTVEILRDIAAGHGPYRFLFALGYAGWGPGQLEEELGRNDWLIVPVDEELLFAVPHEERWERAIRSLGIDPGLLADASGTA